MRGRDLFVVGYLAVQLALPIRGLVRDKLETRGHFSWNMYSGTYRCRVGYFRRDHTGATERLDHRSFFNRPERARLVFHRDALPDFHAWLCAQVGSGDTPPARLVGIVSCSVDGGEYILLADERVDLCNLQSLGVRDRQ